MEGAVEVGAGEQDAAAAQAGQPRGAGVGARLAAAEAVGEAPGGGRGEAREEEVDQGEEGFAGAVVEARGEGVDRVGGERLLGRVEAGGGELEDEREGAGAGRGWGMEIIGG